MGVALLALLAGCGGLRSDARPDRIYVLQVAHPAAAAATTAVPGMLVVQRPTMQPGLETDRIALTRAGNELDFYAASRWGGSLPAVLGAFAVQSLAGSFATVSGAERGAGAGDFELLITARHFEAEYAAGGVPVARVALECLLVAAAPRRVLGSCDTDVREPAADNRMGEIVLAFERAAQRALQEVRAKAVAMAARR
jgi:cholesterol transport system auxiliary component